MVLRLFYGAALPIQNLPKVKNRETDALRDLVPFLQFKNLKNTHGGVLLLVKLQTSIFPKSNSSRCVFFKF